MDNREDIGQALGKIPSGVGVLTSKGVSQESAMLASWFQQASFEPPMITVGVNKERPIAEIIATSRHFILNLFHTNQKDLFGHFARGFKPGDDPFKDISLSRSPGGNAILNDAMSYLECELVSRIDAGDHWIFLGKILGGKILNEGHSMVHTRKNGFHY